MTGKYINWWEDDSGPHMDLMDMEGNLCGHKRVPLVIAKHLAKKTNYRFVVERDLTIDPDIIPVRDGPCRWIIEDKQYVLVCGDKRVERTGPLSTRRYLLSAQSLKA